jgi:hypothetical protein
MALILLHLTQELDCYRQFMPLISLLSIRGFDLDTVNALLHGFDLVPPVYGLDLVTATARS